MGWKSVLNRALGVLFSAAKLAGDISEPDEADRRDKRKQEAAEVEAQQAKQEDR